MFSSHPSSCQSVVTYTVPWNNYFCKIVLLSLWILSTSVFFNIILTLSLPMHIIILHGLTNIIICDTLYNLH